MTAMLNVTSSIGGGVCIGTGALLAGTSITSFKLTDFMVSNDNGSLVAVGLGVFPAVLGAITALASMALIGVGAGISTIAILTASGHPYAGIVASIAVGIFSTLATGNIILNRSETGLTLLSKVGVPHKRH